MKSYQDIANFSNWSKQEKDQYTIEAQKVKNNINECKSI